MSVFTRRRPSIPRFFFSLDQEHLKPARSFDVHSPCGMDCRFDRHRSLSESVDADQHIAGRLVRFMRDLIFSGRSAASTVPPKGIAFAIADLVLAASWAASRDHRMMIRLDHGDTAEEYEEVIEFRNGRSAASRLILWRNAEAVFVQPMPGRRRRFASLAEALESLHPTPLIRLTDIVAAPSFVPDQSLS